MTTSPTLTDRLLVACQSLLPARTMGRVVYRLSRSKRVWLKNALIRGFCRLFKVNLDEASGRVPEDFESFNAFFTRELRDDARRFDAPAAALISPADGTLAHTGTAVDTTLFQAKGVSYDMARLLGDDSMTTSLRGGAYTTVYLAPYNYHRLHMPLAGQLKRTVFVPGSLYSVNRRTAATVRGLYARNERLVCYFEGEHGPFAMVLVGAMNVASISTAWGGEVPASASGELVRTEFASEEAPRLARGDYMGHFNMGSTVVLVVSPAYRWDAALVEGATVQVGDVLASASGSHGAVD